MKNVMWIQSDNTSGKDFYFLDGQLKNKEIEIQKCVKKVLKAQQSIVNNPIRYRRFRELFNSPNFTFAYIPFNGFIYKSIFIEPAKDGRNKAFVYWSSFFDRKNIWFTLSKNAKVIGYTPKVEEQKHIEKIISKCWLRLILNTILVTLFYSYKK